MLAELLKSVGETYDRERHEADFGLEGAEKVADFYNNGGLELHDYGVHLAVQYVALVDGIPPLVGDRALAKVSLQVNRHALPHHPDAPVLRHH